MNRILSFAAAFSLCFLTACHWHLFPSKQQGISFVKAGTEGPAKNLAEKQATEKTESTEEKGANREGMEDDAEERLAWEMKRLRDPQTGRIPDMMRMRELMYAQSLPRAESKGLQRRGIPAWTNRGPWNVGGRTRAFGVDVGNTSRLIAGSVSGGMWLSTNDGNSWSMTNTPDQLKSATCLVQDTRSGKTQTWYYGTGEGYGASPSGDGAYYNGDGLFKSTDGGASWKPVLPTAGGNPQSFSTNWQIVWNLAMDASAPDTSEEIYAACYSSVYRSNNGGNSWTQLFSSGGYFTDVAVTPKGVVYVTCSSDGSQKGIWRSADGQNFTKIQPANFPASYKRIVIAVDPNDENRVYFLAHTPGSGKMTQNYQGDKEYNSFYRYTYIKGNGAADTGGTWLNLTQNLPNTGGPFDRWNVQGSYDMVVKVKPGDSNMVFIGGTNLYRSTTGFKDSTHTTFIGGYEQFSKLPTIASYLNHHPDQHGLIFSPANPDQMYSFNDGGIFKTNANGATPVVWQSLNNGYLTTQFYTVAIDHASSGNPVIIGGAQDNGSWFTNSSNPQNPWVQPRGGDGSYCAIADNRSNYYFSIQNAKMMKATLDAAGNKTGFTRIDPIGLKGFSFINPFILDPNNNNLMYLAGGKYLWRNNDLSGIPLVSGWDSITTNWVKWTDSIPVANVKISCLAACKTPANRVYIGSDNRKLYKVDGANSGTPKPVDITSTTSGNFFPAGANINCVAADPTDGNKLMVVFSNYNAYSIFYSSDGGTTWSKQGGNLEPSDGSGPSVRWAAIIPVSDGTIYMVATSTGVYATANLNGTSTIWVQQGSNTIGNAVCDMIDYRISDGLVAVATHANGIYTANYTTVGNIVAAEDLAYQQSFQVFPNPVKDMLSVRLPENSRVTGPVSILDNLGREILKSGAIEPSVGSLQVPVTSLPAGNYYIRFETDGIPRTLPFIKRN